MHLIGGMHAAKRYARTSALFAMDRPSPDRLGRFRDSDLLRHIFERVVWAAMAMGLVKGEGFAVDAQPLSRRAARGDQLD